MRDGPEQVSLSPGLLLCRALGSSLASIGNTVLAIGELTGPDGHCSPYMRGIMMVTIVSVLLIITPIVMFTYLSQARWPVKQKNHRYRFSVRGRVWSLCGSYVSRRCVPLGYYDTRHGYWRGNAVLSP